jgi:hypothetical protein
VDVSVLLVGANPGLTLFADDGERVAFASVWRVDWSTHGPGRAVVVWHDGRVRVLTSTPALGRWLVEAFTRHFPEVAGLPWPAPEIIEAPVAIDLDPATGVAARAAGVAIRIAEPLGRRLVTADAFPGNGYGLSTVYTPCLLGSLSVDGRPVAGAPRVTGEGRVTSTAFLADAEVWTAPPPASDAA